MRIKVLIGAIVAGMLVGIGVLAGSVIGSGIVSAQAPSASPSATPGTSANPAPPAAPGKGWGGPDMRGFGGFGPGKPGGFGPGRGGPFDGGPFGGANANGAGRAITETTNLITQVKADLAYANGKMDTTDVQRWVNGADALLKSAQGAYSSSQYGQAAGYARAAGQLAEVADLQMAQKLGADKLPSYSQRPHRPNRGAPAPSSVTVTQAQASRILQGTYSHLVAQGAVVKSAANPGDAATYLTDAQNAYKAAYASYQAGNYNDAVASAKLAEELAGVSEAVLSASTAPSDPNAPVTVPAPNFQ